MNAIATEAIGRELWVAQLGRIPYDRALEVQRSLAQRRAQGQLPDLLLLLEHDPVYTQGRRADASELPFDECWYAERGIQIVQTDRGGKTTYHGPGQLVGYPIVDLHSWGNDVTLFVRRIEAALVDALAEAGVVAGTRQGLPGVWVDDQKIGSLGLRVIRGITSHGFSVNVDCDLEPFGWIVPCGIEGAAMTSIAQLVPTPEGVSSFSKRAAFQLAQKLGLRQRLVSPERLGIVDQPTRRAELGLPA